MSENCINKNQYLSVVFIKLKIGGALGLACKIRGLNKYKVQTVYKCERAKITLYTVQHGDDVSPGLCGFLSQIYDY